MIKLTMFRGPLLLCICFFYNFAFSQQVIINDSFTAQQLIENNLIQGCVETSNINSQVNGSINGFQSFAYFEKGNSNFPFENGIMLSSGRAASGGNTLNTAVLNEGQSDWLTDPDLETALGITNTLNATSIEFDFVSISNQIQFNYILASEEYFGDFPCNYSDGFAFLIKETGSNAPYTNIAVIPGTSTPVNTNTIHPAIVGFCPASNEQYFDGFNMSDTNYNGRTKVLSAIANINPYVSYHIKLVIADQTDKNYDSAVFIRGNSFNAAVDLGEDITTCADSLTLDGDIQNPQANYFWYFNSALIPGETQPTLTVSQSGSYTVRVDIPLGDSTCMIEDTIIVNVSSTQTASPIADYLLCDDPSLDGVEIFDLSTRNDAVMASVPSSNYTISYHYSASDAQNNVNPIITPIQNSSNNQLIYIRIEDLDNGCLAYSNLHLVVNALPNITAPTILIACDDLTPDGFTEIDLNEKNDEITGGNPDLFVTYHFTQVDADSGNNPIPMPFVNVSPSQQLFVRVINALTGCYTTTTLTIDVLNSPTINYADLYIDACDVDHDGVAIFDLTSINADILQGLTGSTVSYYESAEDAELGINPIPNPEAYTNILLRKQIIYIRVVDDISGCAAIRSIEIHTNLLLTGTNIKDFSACDIDNDHVETFSLTDMAEVIINNLPDVTITFYTSPTDRDNNINALNPNVPFILTISPTTLYIQIRSSTCSEVSEIVLTLNPIIEFGPVDTIDYCDTDSDGFTSIDLHSLDYQVTGGQTGFSVRYFATEEDADNNVNSLPNYYTNATNPQMLYPRITFNQTGCGDVTSFKIRILPAPLKLQPADIFICDDDQDGFSIVNLAQMYDQIVPNTANRSFQFYRETESSQNEITNITSFNTQTTGVLVNITNTLTGCTNTVYFTIYVSTLPAFTAISNFKICENDSDGFGDFIFSSKDQEILHGQQGKRVFYFRNQQDADNKVNIINKTVAYQNVSNPQTIYVRVENTVNTSCYGTSSFTIEVGTNPLFNQPANWFTCDDLSNDASELFDLSTKVTEITQGINDTLDVTFHTSLGNAQTGTNPIPLQFANTLNPQQIYVRIDNGTICASITSFTLNVIQVAQANPAQPLQMCDTNYDGLTTFDLTLSEIDILTIRPDNIVVTYYNTMDDLDAQTNTIANPTAFSNTSNPQTVFVRLTNTISDCYLALPLELIVNLPPAINQFVDVTTCDNDTNSYNLLEVNSIIVNSQTNINVSYYATLSDAETQTNALNTNYTHSSNNTIIYATVENAITGCFIIYPFHLIVKPLPTANTPNDLEACDDDFDGLLLMNLSVQNAAILGGQNPANFSVSYYNSLANATSGSSSLPMNYMAIDDEIIFARVENNITGCYKLSQFSIIIHPRPLVDIPDQVICLDNLPLLVSGNTNNPTDTYIWSTNQTTPEINISTIGIYSVTVTTEFGCETTQVFNVTESESATINIVETVDFSDPNNITITISGIGNYLYQLDDETPQESNFFDHVGIGYHTITIIDLNGCSDVTKQVLVLDFPKFVTPNNDGYFDTWHVTGASTLPGTVIYIYDRYGKMLTSLTATSRGWDGTYNNENMPATDYWFVADIKGGGYDFQAKGHFALRR